MTIDFTIFQNQGKGRAFGATCVALASSSILPEYLPDTIRPIYATFAGTETELRPFVANLRAGRKAEPTEASSKRTRVENRIEFMKSTKFSVAWQREEGGCLVTFYHPELFRMDPGMVDPETIRFAMFIPRAWEVEQKIPNLRDVVASAYRSDIPFDHSKLLELAPAACLFAAYLDRRTRTPIVADPRFHLRLLVACLEAEFASFPGTYGYSERNSDFATLEHGFREYGLESVGFSRAIVFKASQLAFESLLGRLTFDFLKGSR